MKVSFVIPTKNRMHTIARAVRSCIEQTHPDIEVIVIDDHSIDGTEELVGKFIRHELADDMLNEKIGDKIKYYKLETGRGVAAARNMGNEMATGDIICILDSDDYATSERAEITVKFFTDNPDHDFIYGAMTYPYEDNVPMYPACEFNKERLKKENYIVNSTVAYRKGIAIKYKYNTELSSVEDYDFILQLVKDGCKIKGINTVFSCLMVSSDSLNRTDKGYSENKSSIQKKYADV